MYPAHGRKLEWEGREEGILGGEVGGRRRKRGEEKRPAAQLGVSMPTRDSLPSFFPSSPPLIS